jgi:hypothetical protein
VYWDIRSVGLTDLPGVLKNLGTGALFTPVVGGPTTAALETSFREVVPSPTGSDSSSCQTARDRGSGWMQHTC